jgi:uncharacterized membrane protein YheB (UPF0754 family)
MSVQAEFLKNVRDNISTVQAKASARIESLNGSARKIISEVVEKGKTSQKDISERLSKIASPEVIQQKVKPVAEEAIKRVTEASTKAKTYVDTTSREQAAAFAGGLHKMADRIGQIGHK